MRFFLTGKGAISIFQREHLHIVETMLPSQTI